MIWGKEYVPYAADGVSSVQSVRDQLLESVNDHSVSEELFPVSVKQLCESSIIWEFLYISTKVVQNCSFRLGPYCHNQTRPLHYHLGNGY